MAKLRTLIALVLGLYAGVRVDVPHVREEVRREEEVVVVKVNGWGHGVRTWRVVRQVPVQVVVAIEDNRTDGYMEQLVRSSSSIKEEQLVWDQHGNTYINTSTGQVFSKMRSDLEV